MTATTLTSPVPRQPGASADETVTFGRTLKSEWIKFRTLRSSWYTLLGAVLSMVVVALIVGYATSHSTWATLGSEDKAASASLQGFNLAVLLIGVLGILFVTGEYATGMIRSTFAAVPDRLSVLGAKTTVFGAVSIVSMIAASLVAFLMAQAIFLSPDGHGTSLLDSGTIRAVVGTGAYLALAGVLGGALGWIVRSTAGAISGLISVLFIAPLLLGLLPESISSSVVPYLPSSAGEAFSVSVRGELLAPLAGLGVLVAWVIGALVVAALVLRRRDA